MMNYTGLYNSTSTSSSAFINKLNQTVLKNFEAELQFAQFGEAPISEVGADNVVWAKFPKLTRSAAQAELIDGVTPNDVAMTAETISVAAKQYGLYIILSDKLKLKSLFNLSMIAAEILGDNMARIIDNVIQYEVVDNTTKRLYCATTAGGVRAANRAALGSTNILFTYDLACAFSWLKGNSAPMIGGGYVAILHPFVAHYIKAETGVGGLLAVRQYTSAGQEMIYRGELGMIHGVRMVESANVQTYASAITVYPTLVMGGRAFGVSELQGLETIVKGFGSSGTADPLNQRMTIAVKKSFAPKILNQDSLIVIESAGISV